MQLENNLLPGYGERFNPLLRCIVRRTRGYLEETINPATGTYFLPRVTVRLFGEDDTGAITLGGYLLEACEEAENFCQLLQQRVKGAGYRRCFGRIEPATPGHTDQHRPALEPDTVGAAERAYPANRPAPQRSLDRQLAVSRVGRRSCPRSPGGSSGSNPRSVWSDSRYTRRCLGSDRPQERRRRRQLIDRTTATRNPFDVKYSKVEDADWESCSLVLDLISVSELLKRGW